MSFFRSKTKDLTKNNNNNDLIDHSSKSEDVTENAEIGEGAQ